MMKKYESMVSTVLKNLGVPVSLMGYHYLKYAICLMIKDMSVINCGITKILYPTIAKYFETTPSRVERAIRHAIEVSWCRANPKIQDELFGHTVDATKGKPTNSEFIATVADFICMTLV